MRLALARLEVLQPYIDDDRQPRQGFGRAAGAHVQANAKGVSASLKAFSTPGYPNVPETAYIGAAGYRAVSSRDRAPLNVIVARAYAHRARGL
jgi:hypothetical protein